MHKRLILIAVLITLTMCIGQTAMPATAPCGLNLDAPRFGKLQFRTPKGGQAIRRVLATRFVFCTLKRRDGSLFARLNSDDRGRILDMLFYRRNGRLRQSISASYAVAQQSTAKHSSCTSSSQASFNPVYWTTTKKWWLGKIPDGVDPSAVVNAVRNGQSEWTNNLNDCGISDNASPPATYEGRTTTEVGQDNKSVVDWGNFEKGQMCYDALACALSWYDEKGSPVESDIRFNITEKWATDGSPDEFDIRSVAAHEIGHTLQFDHVEGSGDKGALMWPYIGAGEIAGRELGRGEALENNKHY